MKTFATPIAVMAAILVAICGLLAPVMAIPPPTTLHPKRAVTVTEMVPQTRIAAINPTPARISVTRTAARNSPLSIDPEHPRIYTPTRTITHYAGLPTDSEGRCGQLGQVWDLTNECGAEVTDCLELANRIREPHEYRVNFIAGKWRKLAWWRTCAFAMHAHHLGAQSIKVGNQDIIDIIVDTIRDFAHNGKVRVDGEVNCIPAMGEQNNWGAFGLYAVFHDDWWENDEDKSCSKRIDAEKPWWKGLERQQVSTKIVWTTDYTAYNGMVVPTGSA